MAYTYNVTGLLRAYHHFKASPSTYYQYHTPGIWPDREWSFKEWRSWFVSCLHAKINRNDTRQGRCFTPEYATNLYRDCHRIRDYYQHRIVSSGCNMLATKEAKRRYPHIDNPIMD